jgi:hypothetical protein
VIGHREVTVHGAEMVLISLANVSAERIGHTEAAADEYMLFLHKKGTLPNVHISRYIPSLHSRVKWEESFEALNIGGEPAPRRDRDEPMMGKGGVKTVLTRRQTPLTSLF